MKIIWHFVSIVAIGATCYLVGKASVASASREAPSNVSTSLLSSRFASSGANEAQRLLRADPTAERTLAFKEAVLDMTAAQLESLWQTHRDRFDYHDDDDAELAASILRRLAALDPQAALRRLSETGSAKYAMVPAVLRGWVDHDLEGALAWVRESNDPRARHAGMVAIIEEVGTTDRESAFELYVKAVEDDSLPEGSWRSRDFFSKWVREDPQQALAHALRYHQKTNHEGELTNALGTWARIDGEAAAQWIASQALSKVQSPAYEAVIDGWAETAPHEAAAFLTQFKGEDNFAALLGRLMDKWTAADPEAMHAWASSLTDPEMIAASEQALERANRAANRALGLDYLKQLDHPDKKDDFLWETKSLVRKDPLAALEWGEEHLQDSDYYELFTKEAINVLGSRLPEQSAQHLSKLSKDDPTNARFYNRTADSWGRDDPEAARSWVEKLQGGSERDAAVLGLARGWLAKDRIPADAWIDQVMPESGALRDQLLERLSYGTIMETDTDESARAIGYAQQIENPFLRDQAFETLIKNWSAAHNRYEDAIKFARESDLISETVRWRVLDERNLAP